jgi:hypothetical protein
MKRNKWTFAKPFPNKLITNVCYRRTKAKTTVNGLIYLRELRVGWTVQTVIFVARRGIGVFIDAAEFY